MRKIVIAFGLQTNLKRNDKNVFNDIYDLLKIVLDDCESLWTQPVLFHVWSNWSQWLDIFGCLRFWLYTSNRFLCHHQSSTVYDSLLNDIRCMITYVCRILKWYILDSSSLLQENKNEKQQAKSTINHIGNSLFDGHQFREKTMFLIFAHWHVYFQSIQK